jgi:hypothetical protein
MNRLMFYASARLFGEACLELYICTRPREGKEFVYLTRRPFDDPFYPDMLHLPGVRKIPTETDTDHLIRAIMETPFYIAPEQVEYVLSSTFKAKRGTVYSDVRRVVLPYDPQLHNFESFYDVDNLPGNMIEYQKTLVEMVRCHV